MTAISSFKRGNPCPICHSENGGCKQRDDLILCMNERSDTQGYRFVGESKDRGWGKFLPTVLLDAWDGDRLYEWQEQREQQRIQQQHEWEARQVESLNANERDKAYRQLFSGLPLHPRDRADLQRRGLRDTQIEQHGFKSVEQWQSASNAPPNLPGVLPHGSLSIPEAGYLCPITDIYGRIVGCQVRSRDPQADRKYYWVSSAGKKRSRGQSPYLKGTKENPLLFLGSFANAPRIGLCEGTGAKPLIAHHWLGLPVIGAAGGNFASGRSQILEALQLVPDAEWILYADAGSRNNPNIVRQYSALAKLLLQYGIKLLIADWGQWDDKAAGDIDEIENYSDIRFRPFSEFAALPVSQSKRDRWIEVIKRKLTRNRDREAARSALALERKIQPIIDDDVYEYEPGQRLSLSEKLVNSGTKYILDQSGTGSGKSHDCGLAQPASFGAEGLMYLTNAVRNPTVETLQEWHPVPARHEGITLDSRVKARRAKPGDVLLTEANCSRVPAIVTLRSKGVSGADGDVVCQSCPLLQVCKHSSGKGFGFKYQRRIAFQHKRLRIHPASLPDVSDFNFSEWGALVEESDETLKVSKNLTVSLADVDRAIATMASHPDLALKLLPFLLALRALLLGKQERFGIDLKALRQCLPTLTDIDYASLYDVTQPDLSGLERPDGVTVDGNQDQALDELKHRYTADRDELKRLEQLDLAAAITGIVNKAGIKNGYNQRCLNLKTEYLAESKRLRDANSKVIKKISRSLRFDTAQGSEETRQILERDVQKQWLPEFLGILAGDRGFARIVKGELIVSLPETRTIEALKQMKFTIFLSATESRENLALKLGCKPSDIVVIRQRSPKVVNLEIIQVMDLGRLGMQRGQDKHRRAMAIADCYKEQDPANTKVIDFKRYADENTGVWWRDSRGSNDFQTAKTLILVGTPCRNIAEQLAEYAILTGICDIEDDGFKAYVDHQIRADFQQAIGRPRANRRPDEQLTIVILSDFDLGIPTKKIKASDITIHAGSKNEQLFHAVKGAVNHLRESGQKITQTAIAKLTDYSQQYISEFWKLLLSLLEIPYRKSSKKSPGDDDPESLELIDVHCQVLEAVADEQSPPDLLESLCNVFFNGLPEYLWQNCLHQLSTKAQQSILEALMLGLPPDDLAELEAMA